MLNTSADSPLSSFLICRKFGEHPKESREPHPEHRPRPAEEDGRGHPGDGAGTDGGRQGGGKGLELGQCSAALLLLFSA